MCILRVEDNAINQEVVMQMLKKLVIGLTWPPMAQKPSKWSTQAYDLIFTYIQVPEMDGFDATRESHKRWPEGDPPLIYTFPCLNLCLW